MSQRLGSNINSSLFMYDPVPIRYNGSQNTSYSSDQSYFVKGDDNKDDAINTYEHVGGEEDVFIINSQGGSFQLNRKTLKETLFDLKNHANVSVRQLNPDYTESFRSIVEALRLLYGSQALYDLVLADIRNVFSDVKDVRPGTVAAFFIGCFNDDKFPGPMGCSPKCAASLPPSEGTPGYANCEDLVLIYTEGLFSSLNIKRSSHAYIYIEDSNFTGFTNENIHQLKDAGIENASLVFGNQDGSYREITSSLSIDQLPHKVETITPTSTSTLTPQSSSVVPQQNEPTNTGAGAAIAIIIIIIIILLIVVLYRAYNPW